MIIFGSNYTASIGDIFHGPLGLGRTELIELSSINKVSLVWVSSCNNTGSIRDDPYWIPRKNSLKLIEPSSINKVSLV